MEREALTNCRAKIGIIQGTERTRESVGYSHTVELIGTHVITRDKTEGGRSTHWLSRARGRDNQNMKKNASEQARETHGLSSAYRATTKSTEEKVSERRALTN
jgi:hypothetical protein